MELKRQSNTQSESKGQEKTIKTNSCYVCLNRFEIESTSPYGAPEQLCKNCRETDLEHLQKECNLCDSLLSGVECRNFMKTCSNCRIRRQQD